jgi:hypothetical protein
MTMAGDALAGAGEPAGAALPPAALEKVRDLVRAVRGEAVARKDARVKLLWDLLRRRQLLARTPWLRDLLRRIWEQGLPLRPRPLTTQQMVEVLRRWDILPGPDRPGRPQLKPVGVARPLRPSPERRALPARR